MPYKPDWADRKLCERALRLFVIYTKPRSLTQFGGLLGASRLHVYQWELGLVPGKGRRPSIRFIRRMMRLVLWNREGILPVVDLDRVFWDRGYYRTRDGCGWTFSPDRNPMQLVAGHETDPMTGGTKPIYQMATIDGNQFPSVSTALIGSRSSGKKFDPLRIDYGFDRVGRLIGAELDVATEWHQGNRPMPHRFAVRLLVLLLWDSMGIVSVRDLDAIDWDREEVSWIRRRVNRGNNLFDVDVRMAQAWDSWRRTARSTVGRGRESQRPRPLRTRPRKMDVYDRAIVGPDRPRFIPRGSHFG